MSAVFWSPCITPQVDFSPVEVAGQIRPLQTSSVMPLPGTRIRSCGLLEPPRGPRQVRRIYQLACRSSWSCSCSSAETYGSLPARCKVPANFCAGIEFDFLIEFIERRRWTFQYLQKPTAVVKQATGYVEWSIVCLCRCLDRREIGLRHLASCLAYVHKLIN